MDNTAYGTRIAFAYVKRFRVSIESPIKRLRGRSLVQFFCELSCPNRREFIRKFYEFAPRGAFQARIPGDFSPFERNRASVFAETLLFDVASLISRAASNQKILLFD
jgi:hypothetical protein